VNSRRVQGRSYWIFKINKKIINQEFFLDVGGFPNQFLEQEH
jgi:hypothetical protein